MYKIIEKNSLFVDFTIKSEIETKREAENFKKEYIKNLPECFNKITYNEKILIVKC